MEDLVVSRTADLVKILSGKGKRGWSVWVPGLQRLHWEAEVLCPLSPLSSQPQSSTQWSRLSRLIGDLYALSELRVS